MHCIASKVESVRYARLVVIISFRRVYPRILAEMETSQYVSVYGDLQASRDE